MSQGVSTESDLLPFARLANLGLPPRVRSLLEGSFNVAAPTVEAALSRALDELDRDLQAHTERGSNAHEQNLCLASQREFRQRRGEFLTTCRSAIQRSLLALVNAGVADAPAALAAGSAVSAGADAAARDEDMSLSQIASRAEIRAAAGLQSLTYRFGVIAGTAPIEIESLPLGPYRLCAAIRAGARRFDVFALHRLALYRRIDKCLFAEPTALYDAINTYLAAHRVYAHLQLAPRPTAPAPASSESSPADPQPAPDPIVVADSSAPLAPDPNLAPGRLSPATPAVQISRPIAQPPSQESAASPPEALRADAEVALDAQFFQSLRAKIAARRHAAAAGDGSASRAPIDRRDMLIALKALQGLPPAPVMVGGRWANRSMAHIKQDLMNQLRGAGDGALRRLRDEDSDTIDLIGLLFARLLESYRPNSLSHAVVSRLQIPVLRVALREPGFFTERSHPAARLLSAIVEALADWVEDEDSDRPVVEKLQMVADRLALEYDDDAASFAHCLDDLRKHVGALQRKAEVAERRHVEAAKGRVKLDLARAAAFEVVRQRLEDSRAPAAVIALLDSAWTDAIALSLLRQGVDHPKARERIELVDQLLAIYADSRPPMQRHRALEDLRGSLEEGLAAIGFHDNAIVAAWNDLSGLIDATHDEAHAAAAHAMVELIRQKPRLGGGADATASSGSAGGDSWQAEDAPIELSGEERAVVENLKQTEIGTWFEFTLNRQGDKARRRLCWFSPVTGRCLFLNVRGAKSDDRMLDQLAREISRGTVRQVSAERANPLERAWRAIMAALCEPTAKPHSVPVAAQP